MWAADSEIALHRKYCINQLKTELRSDLKYIKIEFCKNIYFISIKRRKQTNNK